MYKESHKKDFNETFITLMKQSERDNFLWQFCSSNVYVNNYESRLNSALEYPDSEVFRIIEWEKENIKRSYQKEKTIIDHKGNERIFQKQAFLFEFFSYNYIAADPGIQASFLKLDFLHSILNSELQRTFNKKLDFLNTQLREYLGNDADKNPYPRIFQNSEAYQLFEHLQGQIKRNELAEYSFIYWSMLNDKLIFKGVRPSEFIEWLNDEFEVVLSELKQYDNCKGGKKIPNYQSAKILFNC
jgi:hypothetical protein